MADGRFNKDIAGPLEVDHLVGTGALLDGSKYQMVPVGGHSLWSLTFTGKVRIASKDPAIAAVGNLSAKPLPQNLLTLSSRTETLLNFFIVGGQKPGRTLIVMEDEHGKRLDSIVVAVKGVVVKTFMMFRFSDIRGGTHVEPDEMRSIMRMVKATYRNQANLFLDQRSDVQELKLRKGYDDLIDMEKRRPGPNGTTVDFNDDVVAELKKLGHFDAADIHIISTPQLVGTGGRTPDLGKVCYIAHTFGTSLVNQATTYAHEIGHTFHLRHEPHKFDEMMVTGNAEGHVDSFKMTAADIDALNPTDA